MTRAELFAQIQQKSSFLCVGLDPDLDKIPAHLKNEADPIFSFCQQIIEETADFAVAYKPNTAFFEAHGAKGWETLAKVEALIPKHIFSIADAKRGDIGNTATRYAEAFFKNMNFSNPERWLMLKKDDYLKNWVNNIKESALSLEKTAIGALAPDFTINDVNGKPFTLSSLRGSVVLIDFWASWCMPCRKENPLIVELYKEYKPKGLEIIGISLDDTTRSVSAKEDWLKAINQDGLKWLQLSELQGFESPICKEYGIESIPSTFLIDENGVIINRNLRGTVLRNKLIEIFD